MKIDLKPGDFAMIDWNGSLYHKVQHYHVLKVLKSEIYVRLDDSKILLKIPVKDINSYEIKNRNHER